MRGRDVCMYACMHVCTVYMYNHYDQISFIVCMYGCMNAYTKKSIWKMDMYILYVCMCKCMWMYVWQPPSRRR